VTSTQCMFGPALDLEHALALNLWSESGHRIDGFGVSVPGPDRMRAIDWLGHFNQPAQSINQRLKFSTWLELFAERGGTVVVKAATVSDLDKLTGLYDLTVIAASKGDIVDLFGRNASRSPYDTPQRAPALAYVHGLAPRPEHPETCTVRFDLIPGLGELIVIP
jgi:hypothetical protein